MRGCPEGLLDRERNPLKKQRNRVQTSLRLLHDALKWGSPRSALGQNGKSGVAQPLKLHRSFRSAPGQNVGTPHCRILEGFQGLGQGI